MFNIVVGNPPYQKEAEIISENNGQRPQKNIFQCFQMIADKISNISVLIYPGGWIQRSRKGIAKFGMEQINDKHLIKIIYYPDSNELFNGVEIFDGITIVLKNKYKIVNKIDYTYSINNKETNIKIDFPNDYIFPLNPCDIPIVKKIEDFVKQAGLTYLHDRIHPRSLFSIESNFVEKNKNSVRLLTSTSKIDYFNEVKLFTNDKAGKAGRTTWYIIKKNIITKGAEYIDKWKVVASSVHAGGQSRRSTQIEIIDNHSICGRSRVVIGSFNTKKEAENLYKYLKSNIIKFCFLMTSENLTTLGMKVPDIGDYSDENKLIDFNKDIDDQLVDKTGMSKIEFDYIKTKVKKIK